MISYLICLSLIYFTGHSAFCAATNGRFFFSFMAEKYSIIHTHTCAYLPHLLYTPICWWTVWLLPYLSDCKERCYGHWGACIFLNGHFCYYHPGGELLGHMAIILLVFWEMCFPQWLPQFTVPPTVDESFSFSTSLPTFVS